MHTYKINKLPKNTVEIQLIIPKEDIKKEYDAVFIKLQNDLEVEGFRKGKAPRSIAEKILTKETVFKELLSPLLSRLYEEIVKKENLKPIITPRVELVKAKENEDWEIKLTLAEKPLVDLKNYKEEIKKVKSGLTKEDIWVPGKEKSKENHDQEKKQKILNEVLGSVLKNTSCELSDIIIDEELNQRLTRLVDDVRKIGLTTDAYLKSKGLTLDQLKNQYRKEIEETYKLEFILSDIADKEAIKVEKADLDKILTGITDEKERKVAEQNSYYYASILRKQKTIDFLVNI